MSNIFGVGRGPQIYKNWTSNGVTIVGVVQKVSITFIFSGNACEAIAENWSARLDELDTIKKINGYRIRTKSVCNYWGDHLILHTLSI